MSKSLARLTEKRNYSNSLCKCINCMLKCGMISHIHENTNTHTHKTQYSCATTLNATHLIVSNNNCTWYYWMWYTITYILNFPLFCSKLLLPTPSQSIYFATLMNNVRGYVLFSHARDTRSFHTNSINSSGKCAVHMCFLYHLQVKHDIVLD